MKKVSVYTRSGNLCPSSYYRIFQFEDEINCNFKNNIIVPNVIYTNYNKSVGLKRRIFQVVFYFLAYIRSQYFFLTDIIKKPDVIFVSRAILPKIAIFPTGLLMKLAFKSAKDVIWDMDDNVIDVKEVTKTECKLLFKYGTSFIVTSDFLRKYIPDDKQDKIIRLSTTDGDFVKENTAEIQKVRKKRYDDGEVALLWLATYTSLPFVEEITPYLDNAAKIIKERFNKDLILEIVCNRPLVVETKHLKINNLVWSKELARDRIINAHIGIYPLKHTEQTLGKSGFKLLQYMSINLATISSAVGSTNDIVENGKNGMAVSYEDLSEWTDAVVALASSWESIENMGNLAKKTWEKDYSYNDNLKKLSSLLTGE